MNGYKKLSLLLLGLLLMFACRRIVETLGPKAPLEDQILDGPLEGLSTVQKQQFLAGDRAFNDEVFTSELGLGPYFVATSCGSCHAGDGKGHPFTTLTRFGQSDSTGNKFMHQGAPQLQNRALPGFVPEQIPSGAPFSRFMPPANTGLGFLAALSDAQILANADPNDVDGDGISGRPNYIHAPEYFVPQWFHEPFNNKYIGRFGKKAAAIDLLHQTVNAYNQDMGVTSDFSMNEPAVNGQAFPYFDNVPDPEVLTTTVHNVVFYLRTLKVPVQRDQGNAEVLAGKKLFMDLKCGSCHIPEFTTPESDIQVLAHKTFAPYTDLLLHDMGPGLNDGYTEGIAHSAEWRTPALWGLGLSKKSQGGQIFLMHDGRARSINEAIFLHGGEAEKSKTQYQNLPEGEKRKIITFLESL